MFLIRVGIVGTMGYFYPYPRQTDLIGLMYRGCKPPLFPHYPHSWMLVRAAHVPLGL